MVNALVFSVPVACRDPALRDEGCLPDENGSYPIPIRVHHANPWPFCSLPGWFFLVASCQLLVAALFPFREFLVTEVFSPYDFS